MDSRKTGTARFAEKRLPAAGSERKQNLCYTKKRPIYIGLKIVTLENFGFPDAANNTGRGWIDER